MKLLYCTILISVLSAQQSGPQPPRPPRQKMPDPMIEDNTGYESIFDGKSLKDWDGDPMYWRVENGCITGETTAQTIPKFNSFIIWRGGTTKDFELKAEYRITSHGNSGINYRSFELPGVKWVMQGYQADIDGAEFTKARRNTGQNYEERGRTFLAQTGQYTHIADGQTPRMIASLGETAELTKFVKEEDWNEFHLIARGNLLIHILNGHVMAVVLDDDTKNRRMDGELGMQVHVGPPMKVEFRNIRIKKL